MKVVKITVVHESPVEAVTDLVHLFGKSLNSLFGVHANDVHNYDSVESLIAYLTEVDRKLKEGNYEHLEIKIAHNPTQIAFMFLDNRFLFTRQSSRRVKVECERLLADELVSRFVRESEAIGWTVVSVTPEDDDD